MKLPNAGQAIVEHEKIAEYLLNPAHPDNGGKAEFYIRAGFALVNWNVLAEALRQLALAADVKKSVASPHGRKYVLDGWLATPSGRPASVRTIWIVDTGSDRPRLVTAYPGETEVES